MLGWPGASSRSSSSRPTSRFGPPRRPGLSVRPGRGRRGAGAGRSAAGGAARAAPRGRRSRLRARAGATGALPALPRVPGRTPAERRRGRAGAGARARTGPRRRPRAGHRPSGPWRGTPLRGGVHRSIRGPRTRAAHSRGAARYLPASRTSPPAPRLCRRLPRPPPVTMATVPRRRRKYKAEHRPKRSGWKCREGRPGEALDGSVLFSGAVPAGVVRGSPGLPRRDLAGVAGVDHPCPLPRGPSEPASRGGCFRGAALR